MDETYELYRSGIDYLGIRQADIARQVGITRSALSQYLKGKSSLSPETLLRIAPLINISPDYVRDKNGNPYGAANFFRMLVPDNMVTMSLDFSLFYLLMDANNALEFLFLSPPLNFLEKALSIPDTPIYAIALKDGDQNIFLFRRRQRSPIAAVIVGIDKLQKRIDALRAQGKDFSYEIRAIDDILFQRIRHWENIERPDIAPLFVPAELTRRELTNEERTLIVRMRQNNISPSQVEPFIDSLISAQKND